MALHPPGFLVLRAYEVPVLLHWSVPAGAILPSMVVGFKPLQSLSLCVGFIVLVLVHEAGHAFAAWAGGLKVRAIQVTGLGGACFTDHPPTRAKALALYGGGLLAQLLLFIATVSAVAILGNPPSIFLSSLAFMFTFINAIMFGVNLIPSRVGPGLYTDGYHILAILRQGGRGQT